MGAERRSEVCGSARIRAAARRSREDGACCVGEDQGRVGRVGPVGRVRRVGEDEFGFRMGTGLFGLVLIAIVAAIGFELTRQSLLSIQKFGLNFWRTQTW